MKLINKTNINALGFKESAHTKLVHKNVYNNFFVHSFFKLFNK